MNKDWNYAHMWDTMRRALEESAIQGLEVGPLDMLSGMNTLEELEERHRQEREERERRAAWEMQTMFDVKTVPLKEDRIHAMDAVVNNTQAEEAEECE